MHDTRDAEECENDAYLNAWDSIPPNRPKQLGAFLARIFRNLASNRYELKHAKKRGDGQVPLLLDELEGCIPNRKTGTGSTADSMAIADALNTFLATPPSEARTKFVQRYWYGYSIIEIA